MKAASISTSRFPPIERALWLEAANDSHGEILFDRHGTAGSNRPAHPSPDSAAGARTVKRAVGMQPWRIVQRIDDPDPARANAQAKRDLADGATGLALVFDKAPNAFGNGIPASQDALKMALEGIPLGRTHLRIDAHPLSRSSVDWLVEELTAARVDPSRLSLSFGLDPSAVFAGTGRLQMSLEALLASMPQSLAHFFAMGLPAILLEADGRVVHNAGATEAQELGVMIAAAVSHLRMFEEARQPLVYAAPHIGFALSVDQDQLMSIIKISALRKLWDRIQETCSIPPSRAVIHAESSYRMLSAGDPDINRLRTAFAGFGAIVAGAETVSLLPGTITEGLADENSRRLALAGQNILARESHAALFADPAPRLIGLGAQVAALCEAAWEEFRTIEAEGGLLYSLADGRVQDRVLEAQGRRAANFSRDGMGDPKRLALEEPLAEDGAVACRPLRAGLIEDYELPGVDARAAQA